MIWNCARCGKQNTRAFTNGPLQQYQMRCISCATFATNWSIIYQEV
jgi:hypothetical protein